MTLLSAPSAPPIPAQVRTVTVTEPGITGFRRTARLGLPDAAPGQACPVHAFVLAHTVAEETVAALTAAEPGPVSVVHLGQSIRTVRPVRASEQVTVRLDVLGVRKQPQGARVELGVELVGEDGPSPFAELVISTLLVGATLLEPYGTVAGTPAAPAAVGSGEPQRAAHTLTTDWIGAYAHASGDTNPLHLDADAARSAGFDTVIAHGMSVVALAVEEALDRFAAGDSSRVRGLGCRFSAPVPPGVSLEIVFRPDAGAHTVRFTCETPKGVAVKAGWIEFAAPSAGGPR